MSETNAAGGTTGTRPPRFLNTRKKETDRNINTESCGATNAARGEKRRQPAINLFLTGVRQ